MVDNDGNAGGMYRKPLEVGDHLEETLAVSELAATRSRECMHRVISLLEVAVSQLHDQEHAAQVTLIEAASLLRQQVRPSAAEDAPDGRERLLAWQTLKVCDYIDSHITGQILVADLCALVRRSEAHFSRSFKRTFGESPHAGQTPAAWRRAHRSYHNEDETPPVERLVVFSRRTCEQRSPARSSHPTLF
jgi:AraC-like DNA-binding protein